MLALGAACLLLAGLAACDGEAEAPGPLRIGVLHTSFNDEDPAGDAALLRLAIKHLNEAGGVFGQPVQVEIVDAATDPEVAVQRARQMVEESPGRTRS